MAVRISVSSVDERGDARTTLAYEFDQPRVTIGRASVNDIQLPHKAVSASHASVRQHLAGHAIFDEGSTNGVRVNGERIAPGRAKPLRDGDRIQVGTYEVEVRTTVAIGASTPAETTAALARRLAREVLEDLGKEVAAPTLTLLNGDDAGRRWDLGTEGRWVIGRAEEGVAISLADADASREHAAIEADESGLVVRDLGSKNGLLVNGRPVESKVLKDRDELQVGRSVLVFEDPASAAVRALEEGEDEASEWRLPVRAETSDSGSEDEEPASEGANEPTRPPVGEASLGAEEGLVASIPGAQPPNRQRRRPQEEGRFWDMMIYMLAGAILALSAVGLYLLLGSS